MLYLFLDLQILQNSLIVIFGFLCQHTTTKFTAQNIFGCQALCRELKNVNFKSSPTHKKRSYKEGKDGYTKGSLNHQGD